MKTVVMDLASIQTEHINVLVISAMNLKAVPNMCLRVPKSMNSILMVISVASIYSQVKL